MSAAGLARPCGHMFGVGQRSIANHGTGAAENTSSEVERSASTCEWATKVGEWATKVGESPRARGPVGAVWGRVGTLLGRHRGDSDPPGATRGADWAHAGPARSAEWDPHLWRVALAGSDSPLPLAHSAAHSAPRH